jgi:hypothetical protein
MPIKNQSTSAPKLRRDYFNVNLLASTKFRSSAANTPGIIGSVNPVELKPSFEKPPSQLPSSTEPSDDAIYPKPPAKPSSDSAKPKPPTEPPGDPARPKPLTEPSGNPAELLPKTEHASCHAPQLSDPVCEASRDFNL